jgi:HSP20 family protein
MSSIRWDPIKDILNIQERMNRLFHDTAEGVKGGEWQPPVDVYETESAVVLVVELPGVPEEMIDVQVTDNTLILRGEKPSPLDSNTDSYYRLERSFGKFARSFSLPNGLDTENIAANIKDGVLTLTVAKKQQAKPTVVKINKG